MFRFLLLYILISFFGGVFPVRAQTVADSLENLKEKAYTLLKENIPAAESLFIHISRIDPSDVTVKRQLGYLYQEKGDYGKALNYYTEAESLCQSDTISLQIAYCLLSLDRKDEAELILRRLKTSRYSWIQKSAHDQLEIISDNFAKSRWWTRIYAEPYYDTRWRTFFYYAELQHGYRIDRYGVLNAIAFLNVSGDARSEGGLAPEIFSDNAAIAGIGLSVRPFKDLQFNVQYGLSYDFIREQDKKRFSGDFRSVLIYGNGIYPPFSLHNDVHAPFSLLLDVYSSLGYYSRYDNYIGYLQGRTGIRIFECKYTVSDLYLKGFFVRDIEKEFFNNYVEGSVGWRLIPDIEWGFVFAAEYRRGCYVDAGSADLPYGKCYDGFRFFVIFDRTF